MGNYEDSIIDRVIKNYDELIDSVSDLADIHKGEPWDGFLWKLKDARIFFQNLKNGIQNPEENENVWGRVFASAKT